MSLTTLRCRLQQVMPFTITITAHVTLN